MTAALAKAGVEVNEKRVARLMAELGITGRCGRRKIRTTWRDKRQQAAIDLVLRHFTAAAPDEIWVGDITYIPTGQGWLSVVPKPQVRIGWNMRRPNDRAPDGAHRTAQNCASRGTS